MAEAASAKNHTVIWRPQPGPQTALLTCPVFEILFGGARGGGKTDGMLGEWVAHGGRYGSDAIGLMLRRERTQLIETVERSKQIYTLLGAKWHEQDKYWRFPNGARLRFAYLERDADAEAYQGHSYTRVYLEELGNFPTENTVLKLMATLRSSQGVPTGFRATANPGGPGHTWVKARYIDHAPQGWQITKREFVNPFTGETVVRDQVFIPSKLSDNPLLLRSDPGYVANLQMQGSEALVKAWLDGDWSVVDGAFFDCFNTAKHVIPPFSIPDTWLKFRSFDWGSARPFSVGWWAVVTDDYRTSDGRILPRGAMVRYREWYGAKSPNEGLKLTAEEVAEGIAAREAGDAIAYGVADPSIFQQNGGPSIAERMMPLKVYWKPGDNRRIGQAGAMGGWDQMRERLKGDDGLPMLYVFHTCRDFIRTVPAMQHDANRPEDLDSSGEDHVCDESRYACMSRPWVKPLPDVKKKTPQIYGERDGTIKSGSTIEELWKKPRRSGDSRI